MGLGSLKTYTLADARELARECRQMVDAGEDPIAASSHVPFDFLAPETPAFMRGEEGAVLLPLRPCGP
jgi:hypothetical protein